MFMTDFQKTIFSLGRCNRYSHQFNFLHNFLSVNLNREWKTGCRKKLPLPLPFRCVDLHGELATEQFTVQVLCNCNSCMF